MVALPVFAVIFLARDIALAQITWIATPSPIPTEYPITWVATITNDTQSWLYEDWAIWDKDFQCDDLLRRPWPAYIPPGGTITVSFPVRCSGECRVYVADWTNSGEREAEIYLTYGDLYVSPVQTVVCGGNCREPADEFGVDGTVVAIRESESGSNLGLPCPLTASTNGTAANYRWYNVCSGYVWLFQNLEPDEAVGIRFGGAEQPEVNDSNDIKRVITYYRNVVPNYAQTVCLAIDVDGDEDGCPDDPESPLFTDLNLDPGLRWNCTELGADIPCEVTSLVIRTIHNGGFAPAFAGDGALAKDCLPDPPARSFYYSGDGTCEPLMVDDRPTNLLYWLVLDIEAPCINAVQQTSWGQIKGLFR